MATGFFLNRISTLATTLQFWSFIDDIIQTSIVMLAEASKTVWTFDVSLSGLIIGNCGRYQSPTAVEATLSLLGSILLMYPFSTYLSIVL